MATHDKKQIVSITAGFPGWEQNGEHQVAAQVSAEMPATTVPLERRRQPRVDCRQACSYEVLEAVEEESIVIRQGEAFSLNRSPEGMLLFMGQSLYEKQLIEVQILPYGSDRIVNVFETRWTKPVPVESLGKLYLVGCQRIFGPLSSSIVQQASD